MTNMCMAVYLGKPKPNSVMQPNKRKWAIQPREYNVNEEHEHTHTHTHMHTQPSYVSNMPNSLHCMSVLYIRMSMQVN